MMELPAVAERLLETAKLLHLEVGDVIAGTSPMLYVVLEGMVRAYRGGRYGRQVTFHYNVAGDTIGMPITIATRSVAFIRPNLIAMAPSVLLELSPEQFLAEIEGDPAAWRTVCEEVISFLMSSHEMLAQGIVLSVHQRIALHLLDFAERDGERLVVRGTQEEIAAAVGSVRRVAARVMSKFRADGILAREDALWVIKDPNRLGLESKFKQWPFSEKDEDVIG